MVIGHLEGSGQSLAGPLIFGKMLLLQTARGPAPQRGPGSDVGISLMHRKGTPSCHQEVKGRTSSVMSVCLLQAEGSRLLWSPERGTREAVTSATSLSPTTTQMLLLGTSFLSVSDLAVLDVWCRQSRLSFAP